MPIQTISKTVDGHEIKVVQFAAARGFKLKIRLYKLVLPVLGSVFDGKDGRTVADNVQNIMNHDIDLAKVVQTLALQLDPEATFSLLTDLLAGSFMDNKPLDEKNFNDLFIANYNLVYKIAFEVIKANNFFDFGDIGNLLKNQSSPILPKN